jgi:hypothetical protein
MDGLTEGRNVHFVLNNGIHRAAIVVNVWDKEAGVVSLMVFLDGPNDVAVSAQNPLWVGTVSHSEEPKPRTWHWIERA